MYFRLIIKDAQLMKEFLNTITTLSKLTKECVMIISPDNLNFIVNEESTSSAPLVWTEIKSKEYFDSYNMKGIDDTHKNILLSINPSNLARSLSTLLKNSVIYCKIKLTNKQFPCLTVEIELPSNNSIQNRRIVHDVPVNIIPSCDWHAYKLPSIPNSNIVLTLPSIRFIKTLIDKIKNISPSITLYGTNEGELSIVAETESATICSRYRNLEIKSTNRDDLNNSNNHNDTNIIDKYYESSCLIDCKKAAMFLSALQTQNAELSCGIVRERLVQMEIEIGFGLIIHCIIPATCF